jgi:hypothetical protein
MFAKNRLRRVTAVVAIVGLLSSSAPPGTACGPWFPRQYLAQGGLSLLEMPRTFAEIELKLLARDFPTPFRAVRDEFPQRRTRERDAEAFDAAIRAGAIRPPDPDAARLAHRRMREAIRQYAELTKSELAALPADVLDGARKGEFPSEFADYHEGLLAYSAGEHAAARATWERLLARPEGERRYRSVQAAFMIGVLGVVEDWDDAPRWFALARELTRRGFHDEAGLAAASYFRESEWHQQRGDLHAAAECALRSIASGYPATDCVSPQDESPAELAKFARDPLLRNIQTSLLLARQTNPYNFDQPHGERLEAWLRALESAGVREFAGAERVAWLCYASAEYGPARRWLARAPKNSPRALWLAGKLAARDGKKEESLRAFSTAARLLARVPEPSVELTRVSVDEDTPAERMAADHAIAAIGASEFRAAFDAFLRGGHWVDAAYVAERLLNLEELRESVSRRPWQDSWAEGQPPETWSDNDNTAAAQTARLRWLLARRLVRAGRCREARPFFPPTWRVSLDRYAAALAMGKNVRLPAESRALALWDAALEARYHGIELLGTEAAPDWFVHRGDFERDDPAAFRLGSIPIKEDRYSDSSKVMPLPAILKASAPERVRLSASEPTPDKRFHYRYRAAELGWNAARLLPDNDPRTAAMLNLAGRWLAGRDPEAADRFYQAIENRCAGTELGRNATARHWFVDITDPAVRHRPDPLPAAAP